MLIPIVMAIVFGVLAARAGKQGIAVWLGWPAVGLLVNVAATMAISAIGSALIGRISLDTLPFVAVTFGAAGIAVTVLVGRLAIGPSASRTPEREASETDDGRRPLWDLELAVLLAVWAAACALLASAITPLVPTSISVMPPEPFEWDRDRLLWDLQWQLYPVATIACMLAYGVLKAKRGGAVALTVVLAQVVASVFVLIELAHIDPSGLLSVLLPVAGVAPQVLLMWVLWKRAPWGGTAGVWHAALMPGVIYLSGILILNFVVWPSLQNSISLGDLRHLTPSAILWYATPVISEIPSVAAWLWYYGFARGRSAWHQRAVRAYLLLTAASVAMQVLINAIINNSSPTSLMETVLRGAASMTAAVPFLAFAVAAITWSAARLRTAPDELIG